MIILKCIGILTWILIIFIYMGDLINFDEDILDILNDQKLTVREIKKQLFLKNSLKNIFLRLIKPTILMNTRMSKLYTQGFVSYTIEECDPYFTFTGYSSVAIYFQRTNKRKPRRLIKHKTKARVGLSIPNLI
jgi:thioredoxin-related protein